VSQLFRHFLDHPDAMPPEYRHDARDEGMQRRVADYIGGMTDSFAIQVFQDMFVPRMWPA
jgi:dGTPase